MAAKLKVFVTSDGLTEYAVATSSRPKALAAWGVHQDLFASGAARQTDEAALVKAAMARPGEVIERRKDGKALPKAASRPVKRGPSKAAAERVKRLEGQIAALEAGHRARLDEIEAASVELAAREARETAGYEAERKRLSARLSKAREG